LGEFAAAGTCLGTQCAAPPSDAGGQ
jgi:hypothetical protein